MPISPQSGSRGSKDDMVEILNCTETENKKKNSQQLLFEAFFGIMRILGSVHPRSECIFPLLYNFIFKPYHLSSPVAPLHGGDTHMPSQTFLSEIRYRKTFKLLFGIMRIFGSVQPKSESLFFILSRSNPLLFFILSRSNRILVSSATSELPIASLIDD